MGGSLPLGYDRPTDPTATRILQINLIEAETVRSLFALYADLGILSLTRIAALDQNLSPRKADHLADRSATVTAPFSNGQLHYLLTNPVYRGQIRHKDLVHPGQHAAIIDADLWERVQAKLQATAARKRKGGKVDNGNRLESATQELASPLMGRVFDETGDRLTPSHTNRHNRRFRYYVSRRLILGECDPSGWRLPANGLEQAILGALRQYLTVRAERHDLLLSPDASLAEPTAKALQALLQGQDAGLWPLVEKVAVAPGLLQIILDQAVIAATAACQTDALNPALMQIELPFQLRRRGVETRIVTGTLIPEPDHVLQKEPRPRMAGCNKSGAAQKWPILREKRDTLKATSATGSSSLSSPRKSSAPYSQAPSDLIGPRTGYFGQKCRWTGPRKRDSLGFSARV